ncbi:MAG: phenylalanine--tRNA ligase subunit alpha [Candidatus Lokiarchaeota archaeon]|nr:phenylalanine--tRNA ligase subunit alpha [Candidatus Lokiarchaeota archaeon]
MNEQLTEGERSVLTQLTEISKRIEASKLAEHLGQKEERIVSILNSLAQRELVELEIIEIVSYSLTDEGRTYAEKGLPEVRLFKAVKELGGQATMDEAVSRAGISQKEKGIAISWSRKNGWLKITKSDGKTLFQTNTDEANSDVEAILTKLSSKEEIPKSLAKGIKTAEDRKLILSSITKKFETEIIKDKEEEISDLLEDTIDGIADLSAEILKTGKWKGKDFKPFNVEIQPPHINYGRKHPYAEFNDWLREILIGLGFTEWFGPYVETEFWNNDVLFVPQDHVAREEQDQFRVHKPYDHGSIIDEKHYKQVKKVHEDGGDTGSIGWEAPFSKEVTTRLCLRSHTTPVSLRYLSEHRESPQKMFIIERNFRSETLSARHAQEFNQCEGIIMDKGLTLRDLMGYIREICTRVGIKKLKFKPGQFPFTEPSIEGFAKHDKLGWIEVAPGGIFRPEVTYPLGIKDSVLAWGIGSGRLYMAAMGIDDIRELYSRDLSWIRRKYFIP